MQLSLRAYVFALAALVPSIGVSQTPGGGGGGGTDHYPWNPNNYSITVTKTGTDTVKQWSFVNGQPAETTSTYAWGGPLQPSAAYDATQQGRTVSYLSEGYVRFQIQWIGQGTAPAKVLVEVASHVDGQYNNTGDAVLDNGLDSPIAANYDLGQFDVEEYQGGTKPRYVSLNGSGAGEVIVNSRAYVHSAGVASKAKASAGGTILYIAERAVTISGWPNPTYTVGFHDAPVANVNPDPRELKMDVGVLEVIKDQQYELRATLYGQLWGPWNDPVAVWTWRTPITDPYEAPLHQYYTNVQVASMVNNGPDVKTNQIEVTDDDGVRRSANAVIRVHANEEFPVWTAVNQVKWTSWKRISNLVTRDPLVPMTLTVTTTQAIAITKSVTAGITGSKAFSATSPFVLAINAQFQYGVTATVTTAIANGATIPAGTPATIHYIKKRCCWLEDEGFHLAYVHNGYAGLEDHKKIHWVSGNKEDAEQLDHQILQVTQTLAEWEQDPL